MSDPKVATEVAEADYQRFLEAMDLVDKCDAKQLDAKDLKSYQETRRLIIRAIERGHLVIDIDGVPVYTPQDGSSALRFPEPTGSDLMAMDQAHAGQDYSKNNKFLASLTKQPPTRFAAMKARDYAVCNALAVLFLA